MYAPRTSSHDAAGMVSRTSSRPRSKAAWQSASISAHAADGSRAAAFLAPSNSVRSPWPTVAYRRYGRGWRVTGTGVAASPLHASMVGPDRLLLQVGELGREPLVQVP